LYVSNEPIVHILHGVDIHCIDSQQKTYSFSDLVQAGLVAEAQGGTGQCFNMRHRDWLVYLDFPSSMRVYIRRVSRTIPVMLAPVFDLALSEIAGLVMAGLFASLLFVYVTLSETNIFNPKEDLMSEDIKVAKIEFKKLSRTAIIKQLKPVPPKQVPRAVVVEKKSKPKKKKPKGVKLKKKPKVSKPAQAMDIKRSGRQGVVGRVGKARKPHPPVKKTSIVSARPGKSVTTKKEGAGASSPKKKTDPTKLGLLAAFGSKGVQQALDKAYSGAGGLSGYAEKVTGHAGQKESYDSGDDIGTRFKNVGQSGDGAAVIGGYSGVKTKGRGGGTVGYGAAGGMSDRQRAQLVLGEDLGDWDVGGVDKDAILRVIRRNKNHLEWCYEEALQKYPRLEGKILFQWEIVDEKVRNIIVKKNTTESLSVAQCLSNRLSSFRFGGTGLRKGQVGVVRIPFVVTKQ